MVTINEVTVDGAVYHCALQYMRGLSLYAIYIVIKNKLNCNPCIEANQSRDYYHDSRA